MKTKIRLSVHELVDFVLRSGDIDNRVFNMETMQEGSRLHSWYQKKQGPDYLPEVSLSQEFETEKYVVTLFGRADGIILNEGQSLVVEEIKSTNIEIDKFRDSQYEWHLGQAICYASMACKLYDKTLAIIKMTYISQITSKIETGFSEHTLDELSNFVIKLIIDYTNFFDAIAEHRHNRNVSVSKLGFPFETPRAGQEKMIEVVRDILETGGQVLIEAPTGIGKTMSTLFPAVKEFSTEKYAKIFYMTAKTSGQKMAYEAIRTMKRKGLVAVDITITAKEKICINEPIRACNPDHCPFAKNYYTKLRVVLTELFSDYSSFNKNNVLDYARKHEVCPFELQLDISTFADIIIGDYNYFFDPQVSLQRHFESLSDSTAVLVDEAHNLVDRAQAMYSACINTYEFSMLQRKFKPIKDVAAFKTRIRALDKLFKEIDRGLLPDTEHIFTHISPNLLSELEKFLSEAKKLLKDRPEYGFQKEFYPFFFSALRFVKLSELFDSNYCGYYLKDHPQSYKINLLCLDPSKYIGETCRNVKSVIFFSATLTPNEYYANVFGIREPFNFLNLPSPFNNRNLLTLINPYLSVKKNHRADSYDEVARASLAFINSKIGNYLIFVPSYEYLKTLPSLMSTFKGNIYIQEREMTDEDRADFLDKFPLKPKISNVGIVVMGGVFSEGIDLVKDRLIGVVIIGVGMPSISFERRIMQDYYDRQGLNGFVYSFVIPGINRVRQAVGRLIRGETDKGAALFIEARFMQTPYKGIFKGLLGNSSLVANEDEIAYRLWEFYKS